MPYADPEKQKAYDRKRHLGGAEAARVRGWAERNPEKFKIIRNRCLRKRRVRLQEWLATIKAGKKCSVCGESRPRCLEFHYKDPKNKKRAIHRMVSTSTMTAIKKEMRKCVVMCANCHRVHHYSTGRKEK